MTRADSQLNQVLLLQAAVQTRLVRRSRHIARHLDNPGRKLCETTTPGFSLVEGFTDWTGYLLPLYC